MRLSEIRAGLLTSPHVKTVVPTNVLVNPVDQCYVVLHPCMGCFELVPLLKKKLFKSGHHRKRSMQLKSVVQININLTDFFAVFF